MTKHNHGMTFQFNLLFYPRLTNWNHPHRYIIYFYHLSMLREDLSSNIEIVLSLRIEPWVTSHSKYDKKISNLLKQLTYFLYLLPSVTKMLPIRLKLFSNLCKEINHFGWDTLSKALLRPKNLNGLLTLINSINNCLHQI